jgi:hypothetical protein
MRLILQPRLQFYDGCNNQVLTAEGTFWTMVMQPSGITLVLVMMGAAQAGKTQAAK